MECFDMRVRSSVARINAVEPAGDSDQVFKFPIVMRRGFDLYYFLTVSIFHFTWEGLSAGIYSSLY